MTTIMSQIREEASKIADTMSLEIIEMAQKNLTHTRFVRLRKNKVSPETQRERDYLIALNKYVYHKLLARKAYNSISTNSGYGINKMESERWRGLMDSIECGLDYSMVVRPFRPVDVGIKIERDPLSPLFVSRIHDRMFTAGWSNPESKFWNRPSI